MRKVLTLLFCYSLFFTTYSLAEEQISSGLLVQAPVVAIEEPIGTFATPITILNYDPRVDLQERHLAEGQADLVIRGGIFEGSGLTLGSAGIFDPQTGHYLTELPLSPYMLSQPEILTGVSNTVHGFNATAGTVKYGFSPIKNNIVARVAGGSHDLNLQQAYLSKSNLLNSSSASLNFDIDAARSEMSGTRPGGAHNFERFSSRMQHVTGRSQTNLAFGYQDKFFAWPNMYVLPQLHNVVGSSGIETESLQTRLFTLNHRSEYNKNDEFEITAYHREHRDDYEFDVAQPGLFNEFKHRTRVWGSGFSGKNDLNLFDLKYTGQYIFDDLQSTALVFNDFDSRSYGKLAVTPEKTFDLNATDKFILLLGTAYDRSDRDDSEFSPVAKTTLDFDNSLSNDQQVYLEYAKSSKVTGYTALASNPDAGLFKGNKDLGRENSHNFELGYDLKKQKYRTHLATFYRRDRDLVDWTYNSTTQPFATRTATNVDIDVFGIESFVKKDWDELTLVLGYTYLRKSEDYKQLEVDASFYALNYPTHRATGAIIYTPTDNLTLRMDNELRKQEDNILRNSDDKALFSAISISHKIPGLSQAAVFLSADNIWKTNFEDIPGVPGRGRLVSAGVSIELN